MVRVTNYFDTQVRVAAKETSAPRHGLSSSISDLHAVLKDDPDAISLRSINLVDQAAASATRRMSDVQKANWYHKIYERVRFRYRKLQRFARYSPHCSLKPVLSEFKVSGRSLPQLRRVQHCKHGLGVVHRLLGGI